MLEKRTHPRCSICKKRYWGEKAIELSLMFQVISAPTRFFGSEAVAVSNIFDVEQMQYTSSCRGRVAPARFGTSRNTAGNFRDSVYRYRAPVLLLFLLVTSPHRARVPSRSPSLSAVWHDSASDRRGSFLSTATGSP